MHMQDCPKCGTELPSVAYRCKECFHDLRKKKKVNNGPLIILGFLAVMSVIGSTTLGLIVSFPTTENILVDGESQQIKFIRQYTVGNPVTETLDFAKVASMEHVVESDGTFTIVAILSDGTRRSLINAKESQKGTTESYAGIMK